MHFRKSHVLTAIVLSCLAGGALAQGTAGGYTAAEGGGEASPLEARLSGKVLVGTYTRDGSPYVLEFRSDKTLVDNRGGEGRWWIDDKGDYCREWASGPLAGNSGCYEILVHGARVAIYADDAKVIDGELTE